MIKEVPDDLFDAFFCACFGGNLAYKRARPDRIEPDAIYNLSALAELFDCRPATIRLAIKNKELKAGRRGRYWLVYGRDALAWFKKGLATQPA